MLGRVGNDGGRPVGVVAPWNYRFAMDMITTVADGIGTITFNRPDRKNALTHDMFVGVGETMHEWTHDPQVRVAVITGSGDSFSAGADLTGATSDRTQLETMHVLHQQALRLHEFPKPVIAQVNGVAVGAGLNIALGCDIVVAGESARFSEIFVKRGLSLDWGGAWLLPRIVGLHKAKELALTGDIIDAAEAERIGLVNRVVADGDLDAHVADLARRLADGPPIAMGFIKRQLNASFAMSMADSLENETQSQVINFGTADTIEAMMAFREKREPKFTGR